MLLPPSTRNMILPAFQEHPSVWSQTPSLPSCSYPDFYAITILAFLYSVICKHTYISKVIRHSSPAFSLSDSSLVQEVVIWLLLSRISLCEYISIHFPILTLVDIWWSFSCLAFMKNASLSIPVHVSWCTRTYLSVWRKYALYLYFNR